MADISSPVYYNLDGVQFAYPQNWQVTDDVNSAPIRYLFVKTPGNAIVIIQIYGEDNDIPLHQFSESFAESTRDEVAIGQFSESEFVTDGEYIEEDFTIVLLGYKVHHKRIYLKKTFRGKSCYFILQVSKEDLEKVTPGFDTIVASFELTL